MGSGKTATFRLISCRAVNGRGVPIENWPYKKTQDSAFGTCVGHQLKEGGFFGTRKALDNAIKRAREIRGEDWPWHQLKIVSIWRETEII